MASVLRSTVASLSRTAAALVRSKDRLLELKRPVWGTPYPRVGVGIITYNRPTSFERVLGAALRHFDGLAQIFVYNDGSVPNDEYRRIFAALPPSVVVLDAPENRGVGAGKNALLRAMHHSDYMFLLEDDILPLSAGAIIEYVRVSRRSGLEHLSFAHHGTLNARGPTGYAGWVEYYPSAVGAFCMYTRRAIETVGYFDENFNNAWEHVEHTHRLALAGLTSPFWKFADVRGSQQLLAELPEAISSSTIRRDPAWKARMLEGLVYWSKKDPMHFPLGELLKELAGEAPQPER